MSIEYWFNPVYQQSDIANCFSTFSQALVERGDFVTGSPHSRLYRWHDTTGNYYIKIYTSAGKKLRRFIGRSRSKAEWENLRYFQQFDIATPPIVAFGEKRQLGIFSKGVLVTVEIPNCCDLAVLAHESPEKFQNTNWLSFIIGKVATHTRSLHQSGFIHNDLKWRNILVGKDVSNAQVYFIDCPVGRKRYSFLRTRGIIKDLACLDKMGKKVLSRTQRLRFYLQYKEQQRLTIKDKKTIRKIVQFFSGRE